jgi:hypothetical protein
MIYVQYTARATMVIRPPGAKEMKRMVKDHEVY